MKKKKKKGSLKKVKENVINSPITKWKKTKKNLKSEKEYKVKEIIKQAFAYCYYLKQQLALLNKRANKSIAIDN